MRWSPCVHPLLTILRGGIQSVKYLLAVGGAIVAGFDFSPMFPSLEIARNATCKDPGGRRKTIINMVGQTINNSDERTHKFEI